MTLITARAAFFWSYYATIEDVWK